MFKTLVLDCLEKINGERSIASVYHLITGKRSAQTLQDARIYQISNFFGVYRELERNEFLSFVDQLVNKAYLQYKSQDTVVVTANGQKYLMNNRIRAKYNQFNGLKLERLTVTFEKRLFLFIQTITNMVNKQHSFIAITDDVHVQHWVKKKYQLNKHDLNGWLIGLYNELFELLNQLEEVEATIFVDRLSGPKHYGLSRQQLTEKHQLDLHNIYLLLTLITHKMLSLIMENKQSYPFLATFIEDTVIQTFMTDSAMNTYRLYEKGLSIKEISRFRDLKESTIQDHIVEIAYQEQNFPIEMFVSREKISMIVDVINRLHTKKLKTIKENLLEDCSYFQIRLVMATDHLSRIN